MSLPAGSPAEVVVPVEVIVAEAVGPPVELPPVPPPRPPRRRVLLPAMLFAATLLSTFWAGAMQWHPQRGFDPITGIGIVGNLLVQGKLQLAAKFTLAGWEGGLKYMAAVVGILLAHEMGHFLMTIRYKVPASFPFFIPVPITPFGTMGAVIGMDGRNADRKELFDIGLAGPIAGLIVAIPILWIGIAHAQPAAIGPHETIYHDPLIVQLMIHHHHPQMREGEELRLNPLLFAGWVGLLVTGLNMLPVSQLDGGHVTYALFGKKAHWLARGFLVGAIVFIVLAEAYMWTLMVILVTLIGTDHPKTANDRARLGWARIALGYASLAIPILCFPPLGVTQG